MSKIETMSILKKEIKQLKQQTEFYKHLISSLPAHVYWKDKNGIFLGCNQHQAEDLGLSSSEEFIGKTDYDFFPKLQAETIIKNDLKVIQSGKQHTIEEYILNRDNKPAVFLSKKTPFLDQAGSIIGVLGVSIDVTNRKKQQTQLVEQKKQIETTLTDIVDNLPAHVYWKNRNGAFLGCNTKQAHSAGFSDKTALIGKTDYDMPWHKDAAALKIIDQIVMESGEEKTAEEDSTLADGTEAIFLSRKMPLHDAENNIIGVLGLSFDITQQKEAEYLKQEKLLMKEKTNTIEMLAASIAHELRTPISAIRSASTSLKQDFAVLFDAYRKAEEHGLDITFVPPKRFKLMELTIADIRQETTSAESFINLLLYNIKQEKLSKETFEACSINDCLQEAIRRYPFLPEERELIDVNIVDFRFSGIKSKIIHVFFNLFRNALHYIKAAGKGNISISTTQKEKSNCIHVKDSGQGIPDTVLPHIFEQFFSKTHRGCGVGLAFCQQAMQELGGDIHCESVYGKYAEFILCFPVIDNVPLTKF
ncbi:MAG: PAS domain-containing protein [Gammaproteobacteria bacterium]|nr:PAS domain-containing protein [Gammaproteobacteria bacterium]